VRTQGSGRWVLLRGQSARTGRRRSSPPTPRRTDGLDAVPTVPGLVAVVSLLVTGRTPQSQPTGEDADEPVDAAV